MQGDAARALDEAQEGLGLCRELGDRYEEAATYRILALASAALGRADEAKQFFTQGFAMFDDIETPYEWGKLWMSYGDWLSGEHAGRHHDYTEAHTAYSAAIEHFAHIGAEYRLAQARDRLVALEARMREEGEELRVADARPVLPRRPRGSRELIKRAEWAYETFQLVTNHAPLLEMLDQISRVAASDLPVLVLGESGTGKELIARGLHTLSGRTGPIVEVNCGAIAAALMESECFGHLQGAFTGAIRDKAGLFEVAEHGTVFLDEIGEMPLDMQAKLLRFLENGEVRRVGSTTGRIVDVRLVAATNRDEARMKSGDGFRSDLYYRLAHAVFVLPPLRERHGDVELLADHFLARFNDEHRKRVTMSPAARKRLTTYSFPGNVRELRALLERLVVSGAPEHIITPREVPSSDGDSGPRNFVEVTAAQEKRRILDALEKTHYIKADAARMLRMSRTTLLGKMKRYAIPN